MPLDAQPQSPGIAKDPFLAALRRRRISPHNARVIAERYAPHRLPPHWGSSFATRLRYPGRASAPPLPAAVDWAELAGEGILTDRLLRLLQALAERGATLPNDWWFAETLAFVDAARPLEMARRAFERLAINGEILQASRGNGARNAHRAVRLIATGQVLRTAGAPEDLLS